MTGNVQDLKPQLVTLEVDADLEQQRNIDTLNALARELRFTDSNASAEHSRQAYALAQSGAFAATPYWRGMAYSQLYLSIHNFLLSRYQQTLDHLFEAQHYAEMSDDFPVQAEVLLNLAHTYTILGDMSVALDYALAAIEKCNQAGLRQEEADAYNKLGIIYGKMGDADQSLDALRMSAAIYRAIENKSGEAVLHNDIAMTYKTLANFDSALTHAQQSLLLAQQIAMSTLEANTLCTIGEILLAQGDTEQALGYFENSIALSRQIEFKYVEMYALMSAGETYLLTGQTDQALPHLLSAVTIAQAIETKPELYRCYELLADAYKRQGDFETALRYHEQFHAVYQAVFNEQSDQRIKYLQIAHDTETARREAEIFRRQNEELAQLVEELDAFAHTVAHDLKSPLSVLMGYADLLLDTNLAKLPEATLRERLQSIFDSTVKMTNIIDALLLLARVRSADDIDTHPVEMAPLLQSVRSQLKSQVDTYHAQLIMPEQWPLARGYAPWIEEVWSNYLSNALKYGGRPPVIEVGSDIQPDGMVRFWVRDNGPGLTPEEQARLFTPFTRLTQNQVEGHGLGLSIVQRIIEKLDGQVGIESTAGAGSTFSFTLPAVDTAP